MTYPIWLQTHIVEVGGAFFERLMREPGRQWQVSFCPSKLGTRGGMAVSPADDALWDGWYPVQGVFPIDPYAMTRRQIIDAIGQASRDLPLLHPTA